MATTFDEYSYDLDMTKCLGTIIDPFKLNKVECLGKTYYYIISCVEDIVDYMDPYFDKDINKPLPCKYTIMFVEKPGLIKTHPPTLITYVEDALEVKVQKIICGKKQEKAKVVVVQSGDDNGDEDVDVDGKEEDKFWNGASIHKGKRYFASSRSRKLCMKKTIHKKTTKTKNKYNC